MTGGRENPDLSVSDASEAEKLNYIIDMLNELMLMASEVGSKSLVAILNAALVEARTQKNDVERHT